MAMHQQHRRTSVSRALIAAASKLGLETSRLKFGAPVTHVYHPLVYAWPAHELYLRRFGGTQKRVIFLGMNPGPFGMAQTGVPFGEVAAVRDWLGISCPIGKPGREHPKRPVSGFDCARTEVSGQRLWGLFGERYGTPERFFATHLVVNYCPLAFIESTGRNRTPDKLPASERGVLFAACDRHLAAVVSALKPEWVIGIGEFARQRAESVGGQGTVKLGQILHPSPASPAANRDWRGRVTQQLQALGVWD